MKFTKRILEVGRYESPDGEVVVTPERLQHWSETFNSMRAKQLGIPIGWDHHDDPGLSKPIQLGGGGKKRTAEDVVGYVEEFAVSEDGTSANLVIDIPRDEDAEKVKHNLAYVSPVIFDQWKDGRGEVHEDCITRVDLVQHPVDNSQTPFEAIACALRMGLETGNPQTYRMAEDEMEEDKVEGEGTVASDRLSNVISALAAMSIVLPDDTTVDNFFERVESALLTAAAMGDGGETETLEEEQAGQFAAMSLMRETMSPFEKSLLNHATANHRWSVAKRLSTLLEAGKCTPAEHKEKAGLVGAIRLSLNSEGEHAGSAVESWIESREAIPKGTFWTSEQQTRMGEVPQPEGTQGALSHDEADAVVNEILGVK